MFTISPKQAYVEIERCVKRKLVPLITSAPGVGKSSIVAQFAKDNNLALLDLRLSQCTPEDLQGFPMRTGNKATFTPFDIFPIEGDELPEDKDGWLLFLDEMTSATKPVQAAAYKLVLDRMVGSFKLHSRVAIVAAGNRVEDKAVVSQMSTALQSRLIHYTLEVNSQQFIDYAIAAGYDHRITGYINFRPSALMDFRPDHTDKTFPCPRTWEFLSRLIKGEDVSTDIAACISGTIGEGHATEFITFAQEFDRLPKLTDILNTPETTKIPPEASTKYATISMLVEHCDKGNLGKMITYIKRFDIELQIIFARGVDAKDPLMRTTHREFQDYLMNMSRYLK